MQKKCTCQHVCSNRLDPLNLDYPTNYQCLGSVPNQSGRSIDQSRSVPEDYFKQLKPNISVYTPHSIRE